jgi:monofunctional biosynthetic peptidoglycan transglycosylase
MMVLVMAGITAMLNISGDSWQSVNDGVMGGVSSGRMYESTEGMEFRGHLSLENNGGFSSVRHMVQEGLPESQGIRLTFRGDGRDYQFRIRQDDRFDGVSWRHEFSSDGSLQSADLFFTDFTPVWRGRLARGAGGVDPANIRQLGFLIADKRAGDFTLSVLSIELIR